ncbi:DUF2341 domain-containing protein [Planctomycetota bacterium]
MVENHPVVRVSTTFHLPKKHYILPLLLLVWLLQYTPLAAAADWYVAESRKYRKEITINSGQVPADQSNFPVLVVITGDDDFKDTANNGHVGRADGLDILFTGDDGTTVLDYEICQYNAAAGDVYAWVKVPLVKSALPDTVIYIYYGNAAGSDLQDVSGTWDNGFELVQHLDENPADGVTGHIDATGNGHNGTPMNLQDGSGDSNASGKILGADRFGGGNDYVVIPNHANITFLSTDDYTLSAWINIPAAPGAWTGVVTKSRDISPWYGIWISSSNLWVYGLTGNLYGNAVTAGWHHIVLVQDAGSNECKIYVDSNDEGTRTTVNANGAGDLWIGGAGGVSEYFTGTVDEVRIATTNRAPEWVTTEFSNQSNPGGFITVGQEERARGTAVKGG